MKLFFRMLKTVHGNPQHFGIDMMKLRPFEKFFLQLEKQVLEGQIFEATFNFYYF